VPSTFAANNARGLRRLPLYLLGMLATWLVPRRPDLWVFGCGIGPGEGALPLYQLARQRLDDNVRLVWLASTGEEAERARSLGLDVVIKLSRTGFWLTLRAGVAVVTHGLGDVNRYGIRGAFVVQLWHGIPLKHLHLDAPVALTAGSPLGRVLVRRGFHTAGRQIDLLPVSSDTAGERLASGLGARREAVAVTGDPRDDVLLQGTAESRRSAARALLEQAVSPFPGGTVVLYAPTWRDGADDPTVPDEVMWEELARWLEATDSVLLVRSHPLGRGSYSTGPQRSPRIRLLDPAAVKDLTPLLPACDVLITDYSSTAFDLALVGGLTVYLAPDLASYVASRGLYESYEVFSGGRHVTSWTEALAELAALGDEGERAAAAAAHAADVRRRHFAHQDGRATERVLDLILQRNQVALDPAPRKRAASPATVVSAHLGAEQLHLQVTAGTDDVGRLRGLVLASNRAQVAPSSVTLDERIVTLVFPLLRSHWGADGLPLPSGTFRLVLAGDPGFRLALNPGISPPVVDGPLFRGQLLQHGGEVALTIAAPLTDSERGASNQRRLRLAHLAPRAREQAVYFESFYSRSASDNPLGIDRALARLRPDVTRYWSVGDRSVAVPEGAVPIVEYSEEWWRVRAAARVYVVNDWLRWTFRKRRGQHVLQTWHGTMLKRLALDRPGRTPRMRFAVLRQSMRWNALLAQNDHSAKIFRTAYAFRGPVWQLGYPRNDVLADSARAELVHERLGLPREARVVLYAPTWRDDRSDLIDHLDITRFAAGLPEGHVLALRGHSRTLAHGSDVTGPRVIDVTSYPDMGDLMLVADVLVTDYSSVMFDFAATGKPLVFFTPDADHYDKVLRGFYFDLRELAPGPVVDTEAELHTVLERLAQEPAAHEAEYAERYAGWRSRFTPLDDGHAGERVVRQMADLGWFD